MLSIPAHAPAKAARDAAAPTMEGEAKALFASAQLAAKRREALEEMGRPQPAAAARAGSKAARSTLSSAARQSRPRLAGMSGSWLQGRCSQGGAGSQGAP